MIDSVTEKLVNLFGKFKYVDFFLFLAVLWGLQDLSSLTRD